MQYDGAHLHLYDSKGKLIKKWRATSGKPGMKADEKGQATKNRGPLPEGKYTLDPGKYQQHKLRRRSKVWQDWGKYGGRLTADKNNKVKHRDRFYIHGGDIPGSAGCIDLGNKDGELYKLIKNHKGKIPLTVKYKKKYRSSPITPNYNRLVKLLFRKRQIVLQTRRFASELVR